MGGLLMRAHVEHDFSRQQTRVTVVRNAREGSVEVLRVHDYLDPITLEWEFVEGSTAYDDPRPTLVLPDEVFAVIVAAGAEAMPPDRAQSRHLNDAVGTRDRLLGMVERIIDADLAREAGLTGRGTT